MNLLGWLFFFAFLISFGLNCFLCLKRPVRKRKDSVELQEFLGDLIMGMGVVAVTRIDPNAILLRSPRQSR